MKGVIIFLRFLILPVILGLVLASVLWYNTSAEVLLIEFVIHFVGFFTLFVVRWLRNAKAHVFKATFSVFVGSAVECLLIAVMWVTKPNLGVESWVIALHFCMLSISAIALFAYSLAIKAVEVMRKHAEKNNDKEG